MTLKPREIRRLRKLARQHNKATKRMTAQVDLARVDSVIRSSRLKVLEEGAARLGVFGSLLSSLSI